MKKPCPAKSKCDLGEKFCEEVAKLHRPGVTEHSCKEILGTAKTSIEVMEAMEKIAGGGDTADAIAAKIIGDAANTQLAKGKKK